MEVAKKGPGKLYRKGLSVSEFFEMFPDDATAEAWIVPRALARRGLLPALRFAERKHERKAQVHAVPLPRAGLRCELQR